MQKKGKMNLKTEGLIRLEKFIIADFFQTQHTTKFILILKNAKTVA